MSFKINRRERNAARYLRGVRRAAFASFAYMLCALCG
jgi:hypothetical protein